MYKKYGVKEGVALLWGLVSRTKYNAQARSVKVWDPQLLFLFDITYASVT